MREQCKARGVRLECDQVAGYWLHRDGECRLVGNLNDVPEWLNYWAPHKPTLAA